MWSSEEISQFQIDNGNQLALINATLQPDKGLSGKIGIFIPGQMGDLMTAMSVLKYRNEIFPGKEIIWFANFPNAEALKYAPISEVRPWPWPGNGLPIDSGGDFWPILCDENNRLNKELAKQYELTADLEDGYFPAPYMIAPGKRAGWDYPNCSRKIFGVPDSHEWHPYLSFSDEECDAAEKFIDSMGGGKKILIETFAGSGQSALSPDMISTAMEICVGHWPDCKFIFASHKFLKDKENFPEGLFDHPNVFSCANFTVRQCALITDKVDLIISVSSGITVAASCWWSNSVPILAFAGSEICGTRAIACGRYELVTADNKTLDKAKEEFYDKLKQLLNE